MTDDIKAVLTVIGFFVALVGLVPYVADILKRSTKPHSFSWFIWSLLTGIAFFGQLTDNGGIGSWITGINSICCFSVFFLSLKYGEKIITKSDWITFILAVCAIPLWIITKTPLYSMLLVTGIDMLGFYSTFRKSWHKPHEETLKAFGLAAIMYSFGVAALTNYTLITTLYPASLVVTNVVFVLYILWRRVAVKRKINER